MKKGFTYYFSKFASAGQVIDLTEDRALIKLKSGKAIWVSTKTSYRVG